MTDIVPAPQEGIAGVFSRAAGTYDRVGPRVFTHFGAWLVQRAQLNPGDDVLDVAAGRGAVMFPAARAVGSGGTVRGIDFSTDMVRETQADIRSAGWQQVTMQQMDATQLDFPSATFDRVLCGFALFFFPEPHRALSEFTRVLRPGGRAGLTTWADDSPFLTWFRRELTAALPPEAATAGAVTAPVGFDTPARLETALRQAGFVDIEITTETADFVYTQDEEWWQSLWSHGIRRRLEQLDAPALAGVKADMMRRMQGLKQADGIHNQYRAHCAVGTKPPA